MSATKRRAQKPRTHLSLAHRPEQVAGVEQIQGWAEPDPHYAALATRGVGLQTPTLHAITDTVQSPPGRVGEGQE